MKKKKTTVEEVHADLDINEHLELQEKGWNIQRVGLYCLLIFVLTAAMGFYGNGVTSKKITRQGNTSIEFEQFFRHQAKMPLSISTVSKEEVILSFPADYLSRFEIASVVPEPGDIYFDNEDVRYAFIGNNTMRITFYLVPQEVGYVKGSVKVGDESFNVRHLIFP
jgi:hypothetical protein